MNCQFCGDEAGLNGCCADCMEGQLLSEAAGGLVSFGVSVVPEISIIEIDPNDPALNFSMLPNDYLQENTMIDKNELAGRIDGIVLILRHLFSELGAKDVQIEGKLSLSLMTKSGTLTEEIPVGDELFLVSGKFIDEIFDCMEE